MHQTRVIVSNRPSLSMSATSLVISAVVAGPRKLPRRCRLLSLSMLICAISSRSKPRSFAAATIHNTSPSSLAKAKRSSMSRSIGRVAAVEWQRVIPQQLGDLVAELTSFAGETK